MEYLKFVFNLSLGIITVIGWLIPVFLLIETKKKKLGIFCLMLWFFMANFGIFTFNNYMQSEHKIDCSFRTVEGTCKDTRENYCAYNCRYMLQDLTDTWGNDSNQQDSISKSILECYNNCLKNK